MIATAINNCKDTADDFTLVAPVPPPVVETIIEKADKVSTVLFDFDQSTINRSYYHILDEVANNAKEDGTVYLRVDGHTCSIGSYEYNQRLSERRALAVKRYLVRKGVSPDRIKIYAHGETQPASSNSTAEGRRLNRRAVVNISSKLKPDITSVKK